MFMNVGGAVVDLPLYDQEGNMVYSPNSDADLASEEQLQADQIVAALDSILQKIDSNTLNIGDNVEVGNWIEDDPTSDIYFAVSVNGGEGDQGKWSTYLQQLHDIMIELESQYSDVWLISLDIDTRSDIFNATIGIAY